MSDDSRRVEPVNLDAGALMYLIVIHAIITRR